MADYNIIKNQGILTTLGLGSCIGIILYDPMVKIAGMVHIMLPSSKTIKNKRNPAKFADTGIVLLMDKMIMLGAYQKRLVSKIAGGAQMFAFTSKNDIIKIGQRNIMATKEILQNLSIPIIAEDTGGNFGRTIEFDAETGILLVKTIGYGIKQI